MADGAGGAAITAANDPRVTKIGRFFRASSLDELPQLFDVLLGRMSLVGPRPEVPELAASWPVWRRRVLDVSPGLTGLVQVFGRDELTEDEKGRLDLYYVLNRSLEMDLSILIRTLRAVFRHRGRT
jgi:lipopolysaccharide/colanic/teichoic acid biosynthesis glycosyltransferase